jgi:hypothetical protein
MGCHCTARRWGRSTQRLDSANGKAAVAKLRLTVPTENGNAVINIKIGIESDLDVLIWKLFRTHSHLHGKALTQIDQFTALFQLSTSRAIIRYIPLCSSKCRYEFPD